MTAASQSDSQNYSALSEEIFDYLAEASQYSLLNDVVRVGDAIETFNMFNLANALFVLVEELDEAFEGRLNDDVELANLINNVLLGYFREDFVARAAQENWSREEASNLLSLTFYVAGVTEEISRITPPADAADIAPLPLPQADDPAAALMIRITELGFLFDEYIQSAQSQLSNGRLMALYSHIDDARKVTEVITCAGKKIVADTLATMLERGVELDAERIALN